VFSRFHKYFLWQILLASIKFYCCRVQTIFRLCMDNCNVGAAPDKVNQLTALSVWSAEYERSVCIMLLICDVKSDNFFSTSLVRSSALARSSDNFLTNIITCANRQTSTQVHQLTAALYFCAMLPIYVHNNTCSTCYNHRKQISRKTAETTDRWCQTMDTNTRCSLCSTCKRQKTYGDPWCPYRWPPILRHDEGQRQGKLPHM